MCKNVDIRQKGSETTVSAYSFICDKTFGGMQCMFVHIGVLVSGGRDGNIFIWDTRCSKRDSKHRPVNTISMAHKMAATDKTKKKKGRGQKERTTPASDGKHSVTSVCFYGNNKIASAGTADG